MTVLHSWNVNGLRACMRKGFLNYLENHDPDIVCLQEVKAQPEQLEEPLPDRYHAFWNPAEKKGYAGTLILSKQKPNRVRFGLGIAKHDREGRVITATFDSYHVVTVYTPNARNDLSRLDYRTKEWDVDFLAYVRKLSRRKPVIFCGDLNVAHQEIDLARPRPNRGNSGFTDEERARFDEIVAGGFVDTFRAQHPDNHQAYSWWSFRSGARERNVGWRIDYVCVSRRFFRNVEDAFILPEVTGSDHCPVGIAFSA